MQKTEILDTSGPTEAAEQQLRGELQAVLQIVKTTGPDDDQTSDGQCSAAIGWGLLMCDLERIRVSAQKCGFDALESEVIDSMAAVNTPQVRGTIRAFLRSYGSALDASDRAASLTRPVGNAEVIAEIRALRELLQQPVIAERNEAGEIVSARRVPPKTEAKSSLNFGRLEQFAKFKRPHIEPIGEYAFAFAVFQDDAVEGVMICCLTDPFQGGFMARQQAQNFPQISVKW